MIAIDRRHVRASFRNSYDVPACALQNKITRGRRDHARADQLPGAEIGGQRLGTAQRNSEGAARCLAYEQPRIAENSREDGGVSAPESCRDGESTGSNHGYTVPQNRLAITPAHDFLF